MNVNLDTVLKNFVNLDAVYEFDYQVNNYIFFQVNNYIFIFGILHFNQNI